MIKYVALSGIFFDPKFDELLFFGKLDHFLKLNTNYFIYKNNQ